MNRIITVTVILSVAGCSTVTPITQNGPDSYIIQKQSGTALASGEEMISDISLVAENFCMKQDKEFIPLSSSSNDGVLGIDFARGRLQFKCVSSAENPL